LLLAVIWLTALRAGVERLVAYTLQANCRAPKWMQHCGASGSWVGYKLEFSWHLLHPDRMPPPSSHRFGSMVNQPLAPDPWRLVTHQVSFIEDFRNQTADGRRSGVAALCRDKWTRIKMESEVKFSFFCLPTTQ